MRSKKFFALFLAMLFTLALGAAAFAISGEGSFGSDADLIDNPSPNSVTVTVTVNKNDDADTGVKEGSFSSVSNSTQDEKPLTPVILPGPQKEDYEFEIKDAPKKEKPSLFPKGAKLNNQSTDANKVIRSYGLSAPVTDVLLDKHKSAARASGNQEKADRYTIIANDYKEDYFAAYKVAEAQFNMAHYSVAKTWAEEALSRNPRYVPARNLLKQIEGGLIRTNE